jgi:hypothetical protein
VNVDPRPTSLATVRSPRISRANCRLIVRPSPVPPALRESPASSWVNGVNTCPSDSAGMPIPVSVTRTYAQPAPGTRHRAGPASLPGVAAHHVHAPAGVGELHRVREQVDTTCRTRASSPTYQMSWGTSHPAVTVTRFAAGLRAHHRQRGRDGVARPGRGAVHRQAPGLHPREVEQVPDEAVHVPRARDDAPEHLPLPVGERPLEAEPEEVARSRARR